MPPRSGSQAGVAQLPQIVMASSHAPKKQAPVWQPPEGPDWFCWQARPQAPQLSASKETPMQAPAQQTVPLPQPVLSATGTALQARVTGSQTPVVHGLESPPSSQSSSLLQQLTTEEETQLPLWQTEEVQVSGL